MKDMTKDLHVVLVDLKYPMNLGSVARTMSCSGYKKLSLVRPCDEWDNVDSLKYSLFGENILSSAHVYDDLAELKSDGAILFGFSRRLGKNRSHPIMLTELGENISKFYPDNKIVFVFGGESAGLSTKDLSLCDHIVTIDPEIISNSLSLPCAVAMVLYEFKRHVVGPKPLIQKQIKTDPGQAGVLLQRVRELLKNSGFIDNTDQKRVMAKLNSVIKRLSTNEVRLLHAILKKEK
jgi:TrmH family RNA methyltransferase